MLSQNASYRSINCVRNAEVVSSILIRSTNQCERRSSGRRSRVMDDLTDF